ncbi:hypothetical protein ACFOY8_12700 [Thalassospira xianhensis]|uniref:Uncharacterized protein n=1 Tax=Thalassospira xianhensis MCCC 1A02616 TaxID=1177929 RepID=A0A367UE56_9PROT|nr:hypothetical protein [Thalassospira xianhensis]RCK06291.1 hypothetical protein TH5_08735 [Thalassospira xianhensis MCCC 1A02616]
MSYRRLCGFVVVAIALVCFSMISLHAEAEVADGDVSESVTIQVVPREKRLEPKKNAPPHPEVVKVKPKPDSSLDTVESLVQAFTGSDARRERSCIILITERKDGGFRTGLPFVVPTSTYQDCIDVGTGLTAGLDELTNIVWMSDEGPRAASCLSRSSKEPFEYLCVHRAVKSGVDQ